MAILHLALPCFLFPLSKDGLERTTVFVFRCSSIGSQPGRADPSETIYNFGYDDERRALRAELDKCRQENETLRQSHLAGSGKRSGNDQDKSNTPFTGQSVQTTGSFDSGLDSSVAGASTTPRNNNNNNALQLELNECRERERKLHEQIQSLRKVNHALERMKRGIDALSRLVATGIDFLTNRRGECSE